MSGLDRPSEGSVRVGGRELSKLKRKAIDQFRAEEIGFIFQSFFVEPNQTCYYNVALPLEIREYPRRKRRRLVMAALKGVELADKIDVKARNLSGGQKQRLAIARAIVNKPTYIFADEPTGNLDSETGNHIIKLLFGINRSFGSTLVIVTHDEELANLCQIRLTLKDGQVVAMTDKTKPQVTPKVVV